MNRFSAGQAVRVLESGRRRYIGLALEDGRYLLQGDTKITPYNDTELEHAVDDDGLARELQRAKEAHHDAARAFCDAVLSNWWWEDFKLAFQNLLANKASLPRVEVNALVEDVQEAMERWRQAGQDVQDAMVAGRLR